MSLDKLFDPGPKVPDLPQVPTRADPAVAAARRRRRLTTGSIRRRTVLGGQAGGAETVARKQLLGE